MVKHKPNFQPLDKNRQPTGDSIPYIPIIVIVGTETHRLALHHDVTQRFLPASMREWTVSHPVIGAKILTVYGFHKGVPCSSKGFTQTEARRAAMGRLDVLLERIGSDAFNAKIAAELERATSEI
ncbi:hypothetical protein UFOVP254_51 [uncultured Caudovirales phage]|uniref:Uncharacterized protein n=1 Tax=uncultured Caudovirales phage TaxID=2100421 RepID=A0A6J5LEM9_9CAUD|nr:hypothetical protein UFOVP76_2 [uncultured Caudovirales phage]CAB4133128.1 hypothetical protein UFOVP254_51 [uncultured Caudovirales phage]